MGSGVRIHLISKIVLPGALGAVSYVTIKDRSERFVLRIPQAGVVAIAYPEMTTLFCYNLNPSLDEAKACHCGGREVSVPTTYFPKLNSTSLVLIML